MVFVDDDGIDQICTPVIIVSETLGVGVLKHAEEGKYSPETLRDHVNSLDQRCVLG